MNKESEVLETSLLLKFIDDWLKRYDVCNIDYNFYKIKQALQRLEAIDNANPSEALECLESIEADLTGLPKHVTEYDDGFDNYLEDIWNNIATIKQALLKSQANTRSEEILQKYYQEGITLDSVRALKKENAELKGQVPEPKKYIKWEDLEFGIPTSLPTTIKVKMGDTQYRLCLRTSFSDVKSVVLRDNNLKPILHLFEKEKQLFNDLHLERVKE